MLVICKRAFHFTEDAVEPNPAASEFHRPGELQRRIVRQHKVKASTVPQYIPNWCKGTPLWDLAMSEKRKPITVLSMEESAEAVTV